MLSKVISVSSRSHLSSLVNCLSPYCKYDKLISCTFLYQASFFFVLNLYAFWLTGDPWVEDQENGSLPVLASCQALSPSSFKQPSCKLPFRKSQFRYADAPPCISMGKRCDGHTDCINGDDEPFSCSKYMIECNTETIPISYQQWLKSKIF